MSLLVLALVAGGGAAPAGADATDRAQRAAGGVQLVGNGYGHGHGMSQWGAQRAAERGLGHREILAFYYPGLQQGRAGGDVSVWISGDTSTDVVVLDRPGLRVTSVASGKTLRLDKPTAAQRWRLMPSAGGTRTAVAWRGASGRWTTLRVLPGEAELSAGGQPVTLVTPAERRAYRGVLRSARPSPSSGQRDTVNILPLDSYLRGVVPREVYTTWKPAALRAQAVAARTYAAFDRRDADAPHYQICDTTACQVYGGASSEVASTDRAIADTRGQVLTQGGRPAFTQFSASNGGWLSAGSVPYLVDKKDPYDDTYRGWTDSVTARELQRAFPAIGAFQRVEVLERDGNGQWGGRVTSIRIVGSTASTTVSGETFRSFFGLNSTWFEVL